MGFSSQMKVKGCYEGTNKDGKKDGWVFLKKDSIKCRLRWH